MICTIKIDKIFDSYNQIYEAVDYMRNVFNCKPKFEEDNLGLDYNNWSLYYKSEHLELWMNYNRVSIKTSLWKYYLGNNLYTFTNEQILDAVKMLQFDFPFVNWKESTVSVLHIGPSLNVPKNPNIYIDKFYGNKNMTWTSSGNGGNTKSIGSKKNYMIFYNKAKENDRNSEKNILRIEYRIESPYWFEKYFNSKHPTLNSLLENLNMLSTIWYNKYKSIDKDYTPEIELVESINELNHLAIYSLGYDKCEQIIGRSYERNVMKKNRRDYGIRVIRNLRKIGKVLASSESPIKELDILIEKFLESR